MNVIEPFKKLETYILLNELLYVKNLNLIALNT